MTVKLLNTSLLALLLFSHPVSAQIVEDKIGGCNIGDKDYPDCAPKKEKGIFDAAEYERRTKEFDAAIERYEKSIEKWEKDFDRPDRLD